MNILKTIHRIKEYLDQYEYLCQYDPHIIADTSTLEFNLDLLKTQRYALELLENENWQAFDTEVDHMMDMRIDTLLILPDASNKAARDLIRIRDWHKKHARLN